jgi:putative nucleotidyltransferase with HDIG domain
MRTLDLDSVLEMIRGLPGLPETHTRIMAMADNPTTDVADIARIVSTDTALAARVLQVANSPFYGMTGRIDSVTRAIVILGTRTVYSLAIGTGMAEALGQPDPRSECGCDFWKHGLQTAIAARALAENNGTVDPDVAFTAGLLHDMGKLVLSAMFPDAYRSLLDEHAVTGTPLTELEERTFGMDHAQAGGILCRTWNLPDSLSHIVENHHRFPTTQAECAVVHSANVLARLVSPHDSGDVHVQASELSLLLQSAPRIDLLRRLVVSQSMHPAAALPEDDLISTVVDVDHQDMKEVIQLIALTCGYTPMTTADAETPRLTISDSEFQTADSDIRNLNEFLVESSQDILLNIAALHQLFSIQEPESFNAPPPGLTADDSHE